MTLNTKKIIGIQISCFVLSLFLMPVSSVNAEVGLTVLEKMIMPYSLSNHFLKNINTHSCSQPSTPCIDMGLLSFFDSSDNNNDNLPVVYINNGYTNNNPNITNHIQNIEILDINTLKKSIDEKIDNKISKINSSLTFVNDRNSGIINSTQNLVDLSNNNTTSSSSLDSKSVSSTSYPNFNKVETNIPFILPLPFP